MFTNVKWRMSDNSMVNEGAQKGGIVKWRMGDMVG
jgi:hypothetical protein